MTQLCVFPASPNAVVMRSSTFTSRALIGVNSLVWSYARTWAAATALAHGLGVVIRNERDFARIPGLRVLVP